LDHTAGIENNNLECGRLKILVAMENKGCFGGGGGLSRLYLLSVLQLFMGYYRIMWLKFIYVPYVFNNADPTGRTV
jgi:hypothetical protein